MLLMGAVSAHARDAYAVLNDNILTFYYDTERPYRNGRIFDLNTGSNDPDWDSSASTVTHVVFDASFADARPTSCYHWFNEMINLTTITGIEYLKTDEVTTMRGMFFNCSKLSSLDVSGFNTQHVTDMAAMFCGCSGLNTLDVSGFDTSNVNDMMAMFSGCSGLKTLDVSRFDTSHSSNFESMFFGCSGLKSLNVKGFHAISRYCNSMFEGCSSLRSLDLTGFWPNSNKSIDMLKGCSSLNKLYVNEHADDFNPEAFSGVGSMSYLCDLYYPENYTPYPTASGSDWILWKSGYFNIPRAYVVIYSDKSQMKFYYDHYMASRLGSAFSLNSGSATPNWKANSNCNKVTTVYFDSSFAKYHPTTCYRWFSGFSSLTSFYGLANFNTDDVTNMGYMFENCSSLERIDLSHFDTGDVTDMSYMFSGCSGLKSLNLSDLVTENVENMQYMLKNCSGLTSLDLSEFSTSRAQNLEGMFSGCSGLTSLNLSDFYISEENNTSGLLSGCTGLNTLEISLKSSDLDSDACTGVGSVDAPCTLITEWDSAPSDCENLSGGLFRWKSGIFKEEAKPYVLLTQDGKTLIFMYDSFSRIAVGTLYRLNYIEDEPDWCDIYGPYKTIERVIFNPSFANYHPYHCYQWLDGLWNVSDVYYLENLKTDEVVSMHEMFHGIADPSLDLSGFDTSKVTDMGGMFRDCQSLLSLNVSSFDTSKVTDMECMFSYCSSLLSLDVSNFDTSNVTAMREMFSYCRSLTSLDLRSFTFNSGCSTHYFMRDCSGLKKLFIPSTADNLHETACIGVGTQDAPCELYCPPGFNLVKEAEGDGWYMWKGGYFKDPTPVSYVVLDGTTLTFYHDVLKTTRPGMKFYLNYGDEVPEWSEYASTVTRVEFDRSFIKAAPSSCFAWFNGMSNLTTISGIGNLFTGIANNMASMFAGCSKLESLDLATYSFITRYVTDMSDMFKDCSMLTSLKVGWFDTSRVTNMKNMFYGCSSLESLNVSSFNTAQVTDMSSMFYGCSNITNLNLSSFTFNSTSSTASQNFLQNCSGLRTLTIPETADNLNSNACTGVGTQSEPCVLIYPDGVLPHSGSGWYRWKNGYFKDAPRVYAELVGSTLTFYYDYLKASRTGTLYELNTGNGFPEWKSNNTSVTTVVFDVSFADARPTSCYYWFSGMGNLTTITGIENLKTDEVTQMRSMFSGCSKLTSLDVSGFNTEKVKSMDFMFDHCSGLTCLDVSGFNTAEVSSMRSMFDHCSGLTSLDVSRFNTAKVTNMESMFEGCSGLTSLDVSGFNTANVTSMPLMFYNCSSLTSLDVSGFNTENVLYMRSMFCGCSGLTSLDLSSFTFNDVNMIDYFLSDCSGLKTLTIPASAVKLYSNACSGVGTQRAPCILLYPDGFPLNPENTGGGWYKWKSGYFTDAPEAYAVLDGSTLTFYYDGSKASRTGMVYELNTESNIPGWNSSRTSVASVEFDASFAGARPTSCYRWFAGMANLTTITGIGNLKTDEVTNMASMFAGCSHLTSLDVSGFETANVTNMASMFDGCFCLTSLDVSEFETANVTDMGSMFYGCSGLMSLDVSRFDTSKVTNMFFMFFCCSGLTSLDVSGFETANVTNMTSMFARCSGLTSLDVSGFETANVTEMASMFEGCSGLTSLDLSGFDTANVTNMGSMFFGCSGLTSLDLSSFTFNEGIQTDQFLFNNSSLQTLTMPASAVNLNVSACTGVGTQSAPCTFIYPEGFTLVPSTTGDGWYMWMGGYFKDLTPDAYAVLDGSTLTFYNDYDEASRTGMVYELNTGTQPPEWNSSNTSVETVVFDASFAGFRPTSCFRWFEGMSNLTTITDIGNLKTDEVTNMYGMFMNCSKLESLDVSGFNTENVSDMNCMFYNCRVLTSLNVSGFDTENVTNMGSMFLNCYNLESLDVGGFDTENVINMSSMFQGCLKLEGLDVSGFNTENVINMGSMFEGCSSLTSLNVIRFDTGKVTNLHNMFQGCSKLTGLDVGEFDTEKVTDMGSMFSGCSLLESLDVSSFSFTSSTVSEDFLKNCSGLQTLTIPATADNLNATACTGVGTQAAPCTLIPKDFMPEPTEMGDGWCLWKGGYFKDFIPDSYAVLDGSTLTFYYDFEKASRTGTVYELNTRSNVPGWNSSNTSVTTVVFDASFADARPTSCYCWFYGMTKLTTITDIGNLKTDEVTNMSNMFTDCQVLASLDLSGFNTAKVTDMSGMFSSCLELTSLDLSEFETEKVTNMSGMFRRCSKLTSLDLSGFETANVTNMSQMFRGCSKLETLYLSGFNTAKVTNMYLMFSECSSLTSIDVSRLNTAKVTNMRSMFQGCSKLESLDLSSFTFNFSSSNPDASVNFLYLCRSLQTLTIPASAGNLYSYTCAGVGTQAAPCTLIYPAGFTPEKTSTGDGWYQWKGGYFKDNILLGDANGDKDVTVADAVAVVNYAVKGERPDWFAFQNADIDGNKEISVNDLTGIVNLVLGTSSSAPSNALFSYTDAVALTGSGNELTLHLNESADYTATQMVLTLPEGCRLTDARMFTARGNGHRVVTRSLGDGRYLLVVYSATGKPFNHSGSGLLRLQVSGAHHGDVGVSGIQMVDADVQTVVLDDAYGIATGLDWVSADDGETDGDWYSTQGIRVKTPQRGVYIRNGQKVARKK